MADSETASAGEREAMGVGPGDLETTFHQNDDRSESAADKCPSSPLSPKPTASTKNDTPLDTGGTPTTQTMPLKAARSCSCCWPRVGAFYRQGIMSIVTCLAALAIGMIHAYPAVALARWEEADIKFSTVQTTWFASTPMVVSVVMSVVAGLIVERLGVRLCLAIGTPAICITWVMIALSTDFRMLLIARVFQGFVASVYMVVITVYPVEVSQVRWRGIMMGVAEAMVMLGAFVTYLGGLILLPSPLAFSFVAILVPQLMLFFFLRESPLWLARRDREDDIVDSLMCLRGRGVDINPELEHIKSTVYTERIHKPTAAEQLLLLRKPLYLKPLTLCILILLFKELTGQYAALTYTVKMFRMAGSSLDPYWCAVVMGAARFLPCFLSWMLIERLPRRLLLSTCMTVAGVSLAVLGIFLWVWSGSSNGLGPHMGWVPIVCLSIFTLAYGIGVGPISWTMVAELLPSQVRNVGAGIINSCFSLFLFLVGLTFPFSVEAVGMGGVFIAYALCSLCGVIFVLTCLPETRGRSFTEIQTNFDSSKEPSNVI
ncbi:facilitated trehalose transporter Tret1-2 homolog isoform X3 [Portunus trituberculatus]|uniref:facilitated trehalose transporter Tret1-2 homolog isoform X3 n=2 Tax=Portunus trituberculatus TaxID=210409 RepID=UPI001E1CC6AD|nr:facilitated trehalose transporter Tret1-2 homolog isoform X3 [Portunus trituberculatus]XP_045112902.1 facilitated trehalose transporter Tret1-2 homolog isoform X3 [Portunus trituberculatus]XP_045112903.1 facilitated trehalose transporter Tret1-2 homolog isoform X3 [Portunus trituberculatus]